MLEPHNIISNNSSTRLETTVEIKLLRVDCVRVGVYAWAYTPRCVCVYACMGWRLTPANVTPECLTLGVCLRLTVYVNTRLLVVLLVDIHF